VDGYCVPPQANQRPVGGDELAHRVDAAVRARVEGAREVQRVRFEAIQGGTIPGGKRLTCNADMGPA
jgi:hypothetical protein